MSDFGRIAVEVVELDLDRCTLTYGVAPCTAALGAGAECYNTFRTCQDKANYTKGTQTLKFCSRGAPLPAGETIRPYITSVKSAPTEIEPETGVARRSSTSITLVDEPCPDTEGDPYIATRAAASGTYWARLLARTHNYAGRFARVKRAYFTGGVWDAGAFTTELYIIENIKGPGKTGEVQVTLKDPIKLADRVKVPTPTSGKLAVALTTNDMQLTLGSGEGAQYPASGYVRRGDEVIQYTANSGDVLSWPDGTYRAKFGTAAAAGKIGDGVQLCKAYVDQSVAAVVEDLFNSSGLEDTYIDLAQLASEDATWLGEKYRITACLTEPEDISALLGEICKQTGSVIWWSPTEQKAKFKVIGPRSPAETSGQSYTDEANFIDDSVAVTPLDNLRITFAGVYYDITSATANRKEAKNFLRGEIYVDADAESDAEYNDRRQSIEYSRWFKAANQNAMRSLVNRRLAYYRDAPKTIEFALDPKDAALAAGDLVDVTTAAVTGYNGAPAKQRCLVVKRTDDDKGRIKVSVRTTVFNRRYAFIAPNGQPNYTAADESQRAYAYICNSSGKMSNGDDGYLII